jgi:hypothetical protein
VGRISGRFISNAGAAQQDIERCKREDEMYETATHLVDIAIQAHMNKFGIDRETAEFWIHGAMGG